MAPNPNPSRVTDVMWNFWERFHAIEPSVQLGGFYAFKRGYHSTRLDNIRNWPSNYSILDWIDKQGPGDKSSAIDLTFPEAQRGDYSRISKYCRRLMASSQDPNDPRLNGLREWYGQADADSAVEGWDNRYNRAATSDSSHLWHIHISFSRGLVKDSHTIDGVLSVLKGETVDQWRSGGADDEEDEMALVPIKLHGMKVGERRVFTLAWGDCQLVLNAEGGQGRVRVVYMADDGSGWHPLWGDSWTNPVHRERTIKATQSGSDNHWKLTPKVSKISIELLEVGAEEGSKDPFDPDKFSLDGMVQYFKVGL